MAWQSKSAKAKAEAKAAGEAAPAKAKKTSVLPKKPAAYGREVMEGMAGAPVADAPPVIEGEPPLAPLVPVSPERLELRKLVYYFYDEQKLRISLRNRIESSDMVQLNDDAKEFFMRHAHVHGAVEAETLKKIEKLCADFKINGWLRAQRGIGPTLAAVILAEIDISRARHPSSLWKLAGLDVVDGHAPRPVKGAKLPYNQWLRTKLVGVLADCFIKSSSPWKKLYNDNRLRLESRLGPCMLCEGSGRIHVKKDKDAEGVEVAYTKAAGKGEGTICYNCKSTGTAPWGRSDAHRDRAARRYMIKMFLLTLWKEWRTVEGLPITEPYAVAKLGQRPHGDPNLT